MEEYNPRVIGLKYADGEEYLTLYKYISPVALIGLLEHGDFKLTWAKDANDLSELTFTYKDGSTDRYDHLAFISMSEHSNHEALWGNYAEKYTGACIEMKIPYFQVQEGVEPSNLGEQMEAEICRPLRDKESRSYCFCFGTYDDGYDKIDSRGGDFIIGCYYNDELCLNRMGYTEELDFHQSLWRLVSRKHTNWEYEREYRIVMRRERMSRFTIGLPPMFFSNEITRFITKITLGPHCNIEPEEVEFIIKEKHRTLSESQRENYIPATAKVIKGKVENGKVSFEN